MSNQLVVALVFAFVVTSASCSRDPEKLKQEYIAEGDRYLAKTMYSEAIIQYRNAVGQDAKSGEARYKLASAYENAGDLRNALREYVRAADLMPDNLDAQLHAGKLLVASGQFSEAKARADAVLAKDPKNINGLIVLGNALAGLKDIDAAVTQIEEAITSEPRLTFSYTNLGLLELKRGDQTAAETAFKRAIKADPKSIPAHLNLGNYYWAAGQRAEAEQVFKSALAIDAKAADVNRTLAAFYVTGGQRATAEPYVKAFADVGSGVTPKLLLADFYLSDGRLTEASSILESVRTQEDGFRPANLRLATIEFKASRRPEAYRLIDEILKRFPDDPQALVLKAGFLHVEGKLAEALKIANAVVEAKPELAPAHLVRGEILMTSGSLDEAIKALQRVLELAPSTMSAQIRLASLFLVRGNANAAIDHLRQVLKAEPTSGLAHFLMGQAHLQAGDLVRAEAELTAIARSNPSSSIAQTWLGRLYGAKNDRTRARQAFNAALKLEPDAIAAVNGLIALDLVEKKFEAAQDKLESRLPARQQDRAFLFMAGNTYLMTGAYRQAESVFKQLLEIDADNINVYARLARLYLTQGRLDEAKQAFEDLARRQKLPVAATTMIGIIFEMQGKKDEARKRYEQALELDPQAAVAANNLASYYVETGQSLDMALQLAQTAKAKLPDNAEVSDTLGWILYKKGLTSGAITHLRYGVERNPSNPNIHYHLGLAYSASGEFADARRSLEAALKLNPQFRGADDAKRVLATLN